MFPKLFSHICLASKTFTRFFIIFFKKAIVAGHGIEGALCIFQGLCAPAGELIGRK